jgi:hypothetical protein
MSLKYFRKIQKDSERTTQGLRTIKNQFRYIDNNGVVKPDTLYSIYYTLNKDLIYLTGISSTSLDVALERNKMRPRQVPEKIVIDSWNQVQKNIGRFQRFFGTKNFVIVDNNEVGDDVFDMVGKQVRKLLRKKVDNHIAKGWIESELRKKAR